MQKWKETSGRHVHNSTKPALVSIFKTQEDDNLNYSVAFRHSDEHTNNTNNQYESVCGCIFAIGKERLWRLAPDWGGQRAPFLSLVFKCIFLPLTSLLQYLLTKRMFLFFSISIFLLISSYFLPYLTFFDNSNAFQNLIKASAVSFNFSYPTRLCH